MGQICNYKLCTDLAKEVFSNLITPAKETVLMKLFNDSELWCIQIVFCISAACGDVKSAGSHYLVCMHIF